MSYILISILIAILGKNMNIASFNHLQDKVYVYSIPAPAPAENGGRILAAQPLFAARSPPERKG